MRKSHKPLAATMGGLFVTLCPWDKYLLKLSSVEIGWWHKKYLAGFVLASVIVVSSASAFRNQPGQLYVKSIFLRGFV